MESKIVFIASTKVHSENPKVSVGTFITESPVGPGTITDITDAGYPKVNDVAVACFVTKQGLIYQGFSNHIKNLNMIHNKKALFYYEKDNKWIKEGTGEYHDATYAVPYKESLNWKIKIFEADEIITDEKLLLDQEAFEEGQGDFSEKDNQAFEDSVKIDLVIPDHDSREILYSDTQPMVESVPRESDNKTEISIIDDIISKSNTKNENRKKLAKEHCNVVTQGLLVPGDAEKTEENYKVVLENWFETLLIESDNSIYYKGLLEEIGVLFGDKAKTDNVGIVTETIFCSKVVELVKELHASKK